MDEDGDLSPDDDVKPATSVESAPSHTLLREKEEEEEEEEEEDEEEGRIVGIGGSSSTELKEERKDEKERMAGEDLEEEDYGEDEDHGGLVMDERNDDDDGDEGEEDGDDDDDDDDADNGNDGDDDDTNNVVGVNDVAERSVVMSHGEEDGNVRDEEGEEEDEEEGDTTDGAPPQLESSTIREQVLKRPHIQSKRMQEYQEMQQMTHTTGRVFECPDPKCRRVFNSAPGLRYHVKQTHQESMESFVCNSCHKKFKSFNGLKYHIKRKRCQGCAKGSNSSSTSPSSSQVSSVPAAAVSPPSSWPSRVPPPPLVLPSRGDGCPGSRLLDLAHIATGPQSPLLQGLGASSRVGTTSFDSPEKNAVIALSSMAQKRSSRSSITEELEECAATSGGRGPGPGPGISIGPGSGSVSVSSGPGLAGTAATAAAAGTSSSSSSAVGGPSFVVVPNAPGTIKSKRPMNGFMLFAQKNRAEFNKMYPHTNNRMISTKLSEEWTKLPDVERQKWKEDARQMAEVQRSKHPDCWKRKKYSKDRN